MRNPKPQLDPNATPEALGAMWESLSKRQRMALLRNTARAAMPSSAARQAAVAATKDEQGRAC
jgi:hypothetical protein